MSEASWADAVQAIIAILAIPISVGVAAWLPERDQKRRTRQLVLAATCVMEDAIENVADRLEIRFDLNKLKESGHTFREERGREFIMAIREIDLSSLPAEMLQGFIRIRSLLHALTTEMNNEAEFPPNTARLSKYHRTWSALIAEFIPLSHWVGPMFARPVRHPTWSPPFLRDIGK